MMTITLSSVTDWDGFSHAVRHLHANRVAPADVRWQVAGDEGPDLFGDWDAREAQSLPAAPVLRLPRPFVEAARSVFLHADPRRLPLLHRLAIHLAADNATWLDTLHPDRLDFDRLLREVRREIHKMHAFVRFRQIHDGPSSWAADAPPLIRYVAWFEPSHPVLEAAAPFFARRFSSMRWAIFTPRRCVTWDGQQLSYGPGARREDAPDADAGEALWISYYRSIFNPARVKVAMMKKEMPIRFWKNLPEAAAIGPLLQEAPQRQRAMIENAAAQRLRRKGGLEAGRPAMIDRPAASLDALKHQVQRCRDCPVAEVTTQAVFGEGPASARLMIVGEQPGDHEDLSGRPFSGPAGQLIHGAFDTLGWPRNRLYLTNAVKHFHHELRGKRRVHKTPGQHEAEACLHWLESEIAMVRPAAVIALGATAARSLLGSRLGVRANEGRWFRRDDGLPVLVCRHPAAILRADPAIQPALQARWINTLRTAQGCLDNPVPDGATAPGPVLAEETTAG